MPTASGQGKSNYSTTKNFTKPQYTFFRRNEHVSDNSNAHFSNSYLSHLEPAKNSSRLSSNDRQDKNDWNSSIRLDDSNPIRNTSQMNPPTMSQNNSIHSIRGISPTNEQNVKYVDYGKRGTHRAFTVMPEDPNAKYAVIIKDDTLREIVQKLLLSEKEREEKDLDPELVTQIEHDGCMLFFSKKGINPFDQSPLTNSENVTSTNTVVSKPDMQDKLVQTDINSNQIQELKIINQPPPSITTNAKPVHIMNPSTITALPYIDQSKQMNVKDRNGNRYVISESNGQVPRVANSVGDIPLEVQKIIQQDMLKNPSRSGERSYKIIVNKPDSEPQVVRFIVKNNTIQAYDNYPTKSNQSEIMPLPSARVITLNEKTEHEITPLIQKRTSKRI